MCDHCAKVTSQKGYLGQVTCKCDHGDIKDDEAKKEKDLGGCCSKKERKSEGGCCGSKCCSGTKERGGCCETPKEKKSCCSSGI